MGPPGSGNGTQVTALSDVLRVPIISTGAMFRRECAFHTSLGNAIEHAMSAGKLIPDELVTQAVAHWLSNAECQNGFMPDGFPRTIGQARSLDKILQQIEMSDPAIVCINVPNEVIVQRLIGRRECRSCNRVYNVASMPIDVCVEDGDVVFARPDDREEIVRERLRQYELSTLPIIQRYQAGKFHPIDGDDHPPMVFEAIEAALGVCVW